jgi:hypothetical protein
MRVAVSFQLAAGGSVCWVLDFNPHSQEFAAHELRTMNAAA